MGGSSDAPDPDPNVTKLNQLTLKRLQREEADITKKENEKQRLLASGRVGRISLLTSGFTGPKAGADPKQARAVTRAEERVTQKATAKTTRDNSSIVTSDPKTGGTAVAQGENVPFSPAQLAYLKANQPKSTEEDFSSNFFS